MTGRAPAPALADEEAARLRGDLDAAGYTGAALRAAGVLLPVNEREQCTLAERHRGDAVLDVLCRLLLTGRPVPAASAARALPRVGLEVLTAGGLLVGGPAGTVSATVSIAAAGRLRVVADLRPVPGTPDRADRVSGLAGPTILAGRLLPPGGDRWLDVGTGSGFLALRGAVRGAAATGTDIVPRAIAMARLSAALTGVPLDLRCGSWFEPVAGKRFDRVVVNPPYALAPGSELTFRDAGPGGDRLVAGLVRGLPAVLAPGGVGVVLGSWPRRADEPWSARPAAWVRGTGCSALLLRFADDDPVTHASGWLAAAHPGTYADDLRRWVAHLSHLGADRVVVGAVVLRPAGSVPPVVRALVASPGPRAGVQVAAALAALADDRVDPTTRLSAVLPLTVEEPLGGAGPLTVSAPGGLGVRVRAVRDVRPVLDTIAQGRPLMTAVRNGLAEAAVLRAAQTLLRSGLAERAQRSRSDPRPAGPPAPVLNG